MKRMSLGTPTPSSELLSIVIPTLNEGANIRRVLVELEALRAVDGIGLEVLVVDDGSRDGTPEIVEELGAKRSWIRLIRRQGAPDLSKAVVDGWRAARGTWLGVMDGDLQHPGATWMEMLRHILSGSVDLVVGSRFVPGADSSAHSANRTLISQLAIGAARVLLGSSLPELQDPMSGMFAVRRARVNLDGLRPIGYKILIETIVRSGILNLREVPIHFRSRKAGSSKAGFKVFAQYGMHLVRLWAFLRTAPPSVGVEVLEAAPEVANEP